MADDPYNLKGKSDLDLYQWIAGFKESTPQYIAGQQEIRRRNEAPVNRRANIAIGIALLSLIVAIFK